MSDTNERSVASAGSVAGEHRKSPASSTQVSLVPAEMYHALVVAHEEVARLRLTDAEREAVEWAVSAARNVEHPAEASLRGLLERME